MLLFLAIEGAGVFEQVQVKAQRVLPGGGVAVGEQEAHAPAQDGARIT